MQTLRVSPARKTPFYPRTGPLCETGNWRRWAGYLAASSYEPTHEREYWAIRSGAALFDISPLYKYEIAGRDAARLLDRVVTRHIARVQVEQVVYTPWCDHEGKVLDDGTVLRLHEERFRLTSAEPNYRWLVSNAHGLHVTVDDVSDRVAALALQGPTSRDILEHVSDRSLAGLKYFRSTSVRVGGAPVTVTRTGYTGDLGYEVWVAADDALPVWDAITNAGADRGLVPAGMLALDVARVEAGLLLLDVDYTSARRALIPDQTSTPHELSLDWTVALDKEAFTGHRAIRAEVARGVAWRFVGLEVDWPALEALHATVGLAPRLPLHTVRASIPLYLDDGVTQIGYASSTAWSPLLKRYLALAHVQARYAAPGTALHMEMTVEHRRRQVRARVRALPFYSSTNKRA